MNECIYEVQHKKIKNFKIMETVEFIYQSA